MVLYVGSSVPCAIKWVAIMFSLKAIWYFSPVIVIAEVIGPATHHRYVFKVIFTLYFPVILLPSSAADFILAY